MCAAHPSSLTEDSDVYRTTSAITPVGGLLKRSFDLILTILSLLSALLLMLGIVVLIRLLSKGPAFYVHHRVGFNGKVFPCLKFRTMVVDADERLRHLLSTNSEARREFEITQKLKDDPRIIPGIGHFLRRTSLDELPQLVNVLLGHMSLVGPRPVTEGELRKYKGAAREYISSRPGITGLWQISGRSDITFENRVKIDQSYIRGWSLLLDLRIILSTFAVVLLRRGAY